MIVLGQTFLSLLIIDARNSMHICLLWIAAIGSWDLFLCMIIESLFLFDYDLPERIIMPLYLLYVVALFFRSVILAPSCLGLLNCYLIMIYFIDNYHSSLLLGLPIIWWLVIRLLAWLWIWLSFLLLMICMNSIVFWPRSPKLVWVLYWLAIGLMWYQFGTMPTHGT